jgi:hypothetical protein
MTQWKSEVVRVDNGYLVSLTVAGAVVGRDGVLIRGRTLVANDLDEAHGYCRDFGEEVESGTPYQAPPEAQPAVRH